MTVLVTERLALREMTDADAAFILRLLNDEAFLRNIGDRGVRSEDDARRYIATGPRESYARHGFGLWVVERRGDGVPIGICGLLKRDALTDVDLGFALLPEYRAGGYAGEAAAATIRHARDQAGLTRLVAIVAPGNTRSAALLGRLGFGFERRVRIAAEGEELDLFSIELADEPGADAV